MAKKIWISILVILVIFGLKKCTDSWTGIVYPDRYNLSNFKNIGEFKSLELCRNQAVYVLRSMSAQYIGDFECGLNCRAASCEETSR